MNKQQQHKQAQTLPKNHFDIIVIGSGIGGLTAAALLAKTGKSVLVIEQHDRPGGYAHGFKRKKFFFDAGVHLTSGCSPTGYPGGQVIYKTLKALGIIDRLEFIPVNPFCCVEYPDLKISLPQTIDAFVQTLGEQFPKQRQAVSELIDLTLQVAEQAAIADEMMDTGDLADIKNNLPQMLAYRTATLADVLNEFIDNQQLQSIIAASWPYLGLPASQLSFLYWAPMFIGYLVDGAYYCKGGFQNLANKLVDALTENGGHILYRNAVQKISVSEAQVQGVSIASGDHFQAPIVISNADMRSTIYAWVGERHFPARYLKRLAKMQQSLSIFSVYIATDLDLQQLNIGHETFYYPSYQHDNNFRDSKNGNISWLGITVPTLNDPDLAPQGQHLIMLTALLPYDLFNNWSAHKIAIQEHMLTLAESSIPGLNEHLLFVESASPSTMFRYTFNHQGAAYGWNVSPDQIGANRMRQKSPLKGLYFASHWTAPGSGVYGVCVSGMKAAQLILDMPKPHDFWAFVGKTEV